MSGQPSFEQAQRALRERLVGLLSPLDARLRYRGVAAVLDRLLSELGLLPPSDAQLVPALLRAADASLGELVRLDERLTSLFVAYQGAATEAERREVLVDHLRRTARDPVRLAKDLAATQRWLDLEALQDRLSREIADCIDEVEVAHAALAFLVQHSEALPTVLVHRSIPPMLDRAVQAHNDTLRASALRVVIGLLRRLPMAERLASLDTHRLGLVSQWADGALGEPWARIAAMELCAVAQPASLAARIGDWLEQRDGPDGMLIRRNALRLLLESTLSPGVQIEVAWSAQDDPSEHVRQELCRVLAAQASRDAVRRLARLCGKDPSERVRAFGLRELARIAQGDEAARSVFEKVAGKTLRESEDSLCLRVALRCGLELASGPLAVLPPVTFVADLEALVQRSQVSPAVLQEAAQALWRLEVEATPELARVRGELDRCLDASDEGARRSVALPEILSEPQIEKAVRVAAGDGLAVSLDRRRGGRVVVTRGEPRRFRLWRAVHEALHPAPDKRKGYSHTVGRVARGRIVVPPRRLAEVTPTRVPGERRLQPQVGGWGPFVPRVDDLLAVTGFRASNVRLVTALGTVVVRSPATLWQRLRARAVLTFRYATLDDLRERALGANEPRARRAYAAELERLGFRLELTGTEGVVQGRRFSVLCQLAARYLPAAPVVVLPVWFDDALWHLLNTSGNVPWHLALVAWVIFAVVMVRAAWILQDIERARSSIPLSIGGWGTRGKSGTERLKAALFHALRYDVVVKTTGCEAMFINARRDRPAQEIFLYRPYDKATIWEQRDVLHAAHRFGTQVFLWECMALQPQFVELLAKEWMKDEITTLTNAYPDHEDVMGPSGEDVARVISCFMPTRGTTFTSEDQMLPIIRDAARKKGTRLVTVDGIEAELLPRDLLDRFPYAEHPLNIALVLTLAEHLGIDRERALVAMADKVVPDLGVLKTYPAVCHAGRTLEFTNGMSANERAGFLSNWTRLGFDRHDTDAEPGVVTVTVVNNRADRVPRSRVFADILVRDVSVDHIVLIGTNLGGLRRFIEETLDRWLEGLSLGGEGGPEQAMERFEEVVRRLKVPRREGALHEGVARMLTSLGVDEGAAERLSTTGRIAEALRGDPAEVEAALKVALAEHGAVDPSLRAEVCRHAARLASSLTGVAKAKERIVELVGAGKVDEADLVLRGLYRESFLERVATVERADTTGDGVIDFVARQVPPGHYARLMGCQNIKGTGLDFVYRWLSIDAVRTALTRLKSEPSSRAETLSWILSRPDFGLIDCREALAELRVIREAGEPEWAEHMALVDAAIERLVRVERERLSRMTVSAKKALWERSLQRVEPLLDHLDSVRRRRHATRIMSDLFEGRLGQGRAALLMRDLVAREKGGWLAKDVKKWLDQRAARKRAETPLATPSEPPAEQAPSPGALVESNPPVPTAGEVVTEVADANSPGREG